MGGFARLHFVRRRTLLFPFKWQCVFIPILPSNLSYTVRAPVPFIVGLHR